MATPVLKTKAIWTIGAILVAVILAALMTSYFMGSEDTGKHDSNQMPVAVVAHLGQPLPPLPPSIQTQVNRYSQFSSIVYTEPLLKVTVITLEGRQVELPPGSCRFWLDGDKLAMVQMVYPDSKRFAEIVSSFRDWLQSQQIEPDENMNKILASWQDDRPGREGGPQYLPRQEKAVSALTPKSGFDIHIQPLPRKGWMYQLNISLGVDEMMKIYNNAAHAAESAITPNRDEESISIP